MSFVSIKHHASLPSQLEACHTELRIHGLIGLLDLGHVKLLFYIKRRQHVADIGDRAVYRVVEGGHVAVCRRPFPTLADVSSRLLWNCSLYSSHFIYRYAHALFAPLHFSNYRNSKKQREFNPYCRCSPLDCSTSHTTMISPIICSVYLFHVQVIW